MSEETSIPRAFHEWFKKQSHRDDAVGWAAKWFLHKGQGRYPKKPNLFPTCDHWLKIVKEKASKAHQLAAKSAFITAWEEFHSGVELSNQVIEMPLGVVTMGSTISRLRKIVKGNHERGEQEEEEEIAVTAFKGPVATIGVRQRLTTSYGGDWVQLGVMLSVPCYPEEIEDAFKFADDWVTGKIQSEVDKFKGGGPPEPSVGSSDGSHGEEEDQKDDGETRTIGDEIDNVDKYLEGDSESGSGHEGIGEMVTEAVAKEVDKESFKLESDPREDEAALVPGKDYGI